MTDADAHPALFERTVRGVYPDAATHPFGLVYKSGFPSEYTSRCVNLNTGEGDTYTHAIPDNFNVDGDIWRYILGERLATTCGIDAPRVLPIKHLWRAMVHHPLVMSHSVVRMVQPSAVSPPLIPASWHAPGLSLQVFVDHTKLDPVEVDHDKILVTYDRVNSTVADYDVRYGSPSEYDVRFFTTPSVESGPRWCIHIPVDVAREAIRGYMRTVQAR